MIAAMLTLFVAVLTGVVLLSLWLEPLPVDRDRRLTALGIAHGTIAAMGVLTWVVFAITRDDWPGIISLVLLALAVVAGASTLGATARRRRRDSITTAPRAVVVVHGVVAIGAAGLALVAFLGR